MFGGSFWRWSRRWRNRNRTPLTKDNPDDDRAAPSRPERRRLFPAKSCSSPNRHKHVVDREIVGETPFPAAQIVAHAGKARGRQPDAAQRKGKFRWTHKAVPVMRARR